MKKLFCVLFVFCLFVSIKCQLAQDDQVTTVIPGYSHTIYSGYFDVPLLSYGAKIHYIYYQSQNKPSTDPIIVYFPGSPGCSPMANMIQQNGPFIFKAGSNKLQLNPNSWNKNAGMVYFDNPIGSGFSIGNSNKTITQNDLIIQIKFTINLFLMRHLTLKKNDLYFAGSGYGATIATILSKNVFDANKQQPHNIINLKGILLGNPCINNDQCYNSGSQKYSVYHYEFLYKRGFYSHHQYNQFKGSCLIDYNSYTCYNLRQTLDKFYQSTQTSVYNIYNKCYSQSQNGINLGCQDQLPTIQYFNDIHFRQNWNINNNSQTWQPCNKEIYSKFIQGNGSLHYLHDLINNQHLRIWIYSGDMDSTVPFIGTLKWINHYRQHYQIPIKNNWRQFWVPGLHPGQDQIGGFVWQLKDLTVVQVKGAGFKASADQPIAMEQVLNAFLNGKSLPRKNQL